MSVGLIQSAEALRAKVKVSLKRNSASTLQNRNSAAVSRFRLNTAMSALTSYIFNLTVCPMNFGLFYSHSLNLLIYQYTTDSVYRKKLIIL